MSLRLRFRRGGDGGAVADERVARARDVCGVATGGRSADALALLLHDGDRRDDVPWPWSRSGGEGSGVGHG